MPRGLPRVFNPAKDVRLRYMRVPELGPPPYKLAADPFHLTFLLPRELTLGVATGRHHPCLHRCLMRVEHHRDRDYMVRIQAPSRELCFEQARIYLRVAAKGHIEAGAALQIIGVLTTPPPARDCWLGSRRDGWTILIGADVAFAPTAIACDLPRQRGVG